MFLKFLLEQATDCSDPTILEPVRSILEKRDSIFHRSLPLVGFPLEMCNVLREGLEHVYLGANSLTDSHPGKNLPVVAKQPLNFIDCVTRFAVISHLEFQCSVECIHHFQSISNVPGNLEPRIRENVFCFNAPTIPRVPRNLNLHLTPPCLHCCVSPHAGTQPPLFLLRKHLILARS